jgi:hypothetical protein
MFLLGNVPDWNMQPYLVGSDLFRLIISMRWRFLFHPFSSQPSRFYKGLEGVNIVRPKMEFPSSKPIGSRVHPLAHWVNRV